MTDDEILEIVERALPDFELQGSWYVTCGNIVARELGDAIAVDDVLRISRALLAHLHARPLPVGEVTQDAKARAAAYAPWFLFGAQAQELAAAIKEDGCCHHWKEVVKLLDEIAASPEKESALPVGEGKPLAAIKGIHGNPAFSLENVAASVHAALAANGAEADSTVKTPPEGGALCPVEAPGFVAREEHCTAAMLQGKGEGNV